MSNPDGISDSIDTLSAVGRQLLRLDAATAYTKLVIEGNGNLIAQSMLEALSPSELIDGPVKDPDAAAAAQAGLWLRHDWLEPGHGIVQSIESPTGALWHALMHRREGDFWNAKYWYDQASGHPTLSTLAPRISDLVNPLPADKMLFRITATGWNPNAFVDLVEAVYEKPNDPRYRLAIAIQEIEWHAVFQQTVRAASGR